MPTRRATGLPHFLSPFFNGMRRMGRPGVEALVETLSSQTLLGSGCQLGKGFRLFNSQLSQDLPV